LLAALLCHEIGVHQLGRGIGRRPGPMRLTAVRVMLQATALTAKAWAATAPMASPWAAMVPTAACGGWLASVSVRWRGRRRR